MRTTALLTSLKLWQVAAVGFVVGVGLHALAFTAILDDGGDGASTSPAPVQLVPAEQPLATPVATPVVLPDRMSCDEILGTQYRSIPERDWYRSNCT
jgi:hypothetical protein